MVIIWIIVAIIMFSIIVLIHEYWHFKASRIFWVKVEEFGLWIPPRAKKLFTDKKWTLFSLNWLPIWGFVKLKWENVEMLENKWDKDALINKPAWQQSIIMLAWVIMNFFLAFIIFTLLFFFWVKPIWINTKIETNLDLKIIPTYEQAIESWLLIKNKWILLYPVEWSIAEKAWIKEWDLLTHVNWKEIDTPENIIKLISENTWKEIKLEINESIIKIIPSNEWKIWSYLSPNIKLNEDFKYKYWLLDSIKHWATETYNQSLLTFKAIWILGQKIFNPKNEKERKEAVENLKWPIWMVDFISSSLSAWIMFMIIIWAIISINLWVFNLLPIPALDWWRFLLININSFIKMIFWKKAINEKTEWIIHLLFFVFLIALSIIIGYNDVVNIINK